METIIKKAIEGGYVHNYDLPGKLMLLDPLFWQALGKACGWNPHKKISDVDWIDHALRFHKINLTQGWDKAVEYLADLINK